MILNIEKDGFREDNTEGYSQEEIDKMNDELENMLQVQNVSPDDLDEYYQFVKCFSNLITKKIYLSKIIKNEILNYN